MGWTLVRPAAFPPGCVGRITRPESELQLSPDQVGDFGYITIPSERRSSFVKNPCLGFPGGSVAETLNFQFRGPGFHVWSGS